MPRRPAASALTAKLSSDERSKALDKQREPMKHILPEKEDLPTWGMDKGTWDVSDTNGLGYSGDRFPIFKWKVTGVTTDGKEYPRRNVNEWSTSTKQEDIDQVNLFLIAFKQFQEQPETDPNSFFMLAGIHGIPMFSNLPSSLVARDGKPIEQTFQTGAFCHHSTLRFPSWHRPYVTLLEQYIQLHMMAIAKAYPETDDLRNKYIKAATEWRLPYWDPAQIVDHNHYNGVGIPSILTWPEKDVYHPHNGWITIHNPLYSYKFQEPKAKGRSKEMKWENKNDQGNLIKAHDFSKLLYTVRQPYATRSTQRVPGRTANDATSEEEWIAFQELFDKHTPQANQNNYHILEIFREDVSYRQNVLNALLEKKPYAYFASTFRKPAEDKKNKVHHIPTGVPLEQVHNTVHNYCGGAGHMANIEVAGFDPIFWLHHANIDRWLAIWERLHGKMEWTDKDVGSKPEDKQANGLPETPLYPFYRDLDTPWDTPSLNGTARKGLGYYYENVEMEPESLRKWLVREYDGLVHDLRRDVVRHVLTEDLTNGRYHFEDFKVGVAYERFALDGSPFVIHFFLGKFDDTTPSSWDTLSTRLGSIFNFVSGTERGDGGATCSNCTTQKDAHIHGYGEISLTQAILKAKLDPNFPSTGFEEISKADLMLGFLRKNLHCRVTKLVGDVVKYVPNKELKSLKVELYHRAGHISINPPPGEEYEEPSYNEWVYGGDFDFLCDHDEPLAEGK